MLQVGTWGPTQHLLAGARTQHTTLLAPKRGPGVTLCAPLASLPFASDSIDAIVLPHTLELVEDPYAVLTMHYFKQAGSRGQALHQDQFYLKVEPGTCVAAWLALEPIDEENGCMSVVPGSQNLPVLCTIQSDITQSFTDVTVPVPEDMKAEPVIMETGDVLFFNGSVIHGSGPNKSKDRFRRSLIAHYATGDALKLGSWYKAMDFDGNPITLEANPGGAKCGRWVDLEGSPVVELVDKEAHDLRNLRD